MTDPTPEPESASLAEEEIIAEDYDDAPQQEAHGCMGADTFDPYQVRIISDLLLSTFSWMYPDRYQYYFDKFYYLF